MGFLHIDLIPMLHTHVVVNFMISESCVLLLYSADCKRKLDLKIDHLVQNPRIIKKNLFRQTKIFKKYYELLVSDIVQMMIYRNNN